MVSYILTSLSDDNDSVTASISNQVETISLGELYTQLVAHEQCLELRSGGINSSTNLVSRGGRSSGNNPSSPNRGRGGFSRGGGNGGRNRGGRNSVKRVPFQAGVICQVYGNEGHPTLNCFKRFDQSFSGPPQKSASAATSGYGATDHITSELDKLSVRDRYHGGERIHAANGSGMELSHVGHSTVQSLPHKIHLRNVLHVPAASKNLVSVNRLTRDNNAFVEFHPDYFSIKEALTKKTILRGKAEGGLYPIKSLPSRTSSNKQVLGVTKPTTSTRHSRLMHPSTSVISQNVSCHKLSFIRDVNNKHVCDACQQGKSHQLPYPKSTSVSSFPLDLYFF